MKFDKSAMTTLPLPAPLRGVIAPLLTPLRGPDALDCDGLSHLLEHVIGGAVAGLFILGSTGEGPSLGYRLRSEFIRLATAQADNRLPVLVGITDTAAIESRRMADVAAQAGAQAVVIAPPYYLLYSQDDLRAYIEEMADTLPLPLFLYNYPGLTKIPYSVDTVRLLSAHPKILGLKDSSGDMKYFSRIVEAVRGRPDFTVLIGPENKLVQAMRLGAHGGVCGGCNVNPRLFVRIFEAAQSGRWQDAEELQETAASMGCLLYALGDSNSSYLRGIKAAAAGMGLCQDTLAPPLRPFSGPEKVCIQTALRTLGLID